MDKEKCNCNCNCSNDKYEQLSKFIQNTKNKKNNLMQILHVAQGMFGYISNEVQEFIAKEMNISPATVFGVVTFYSYFSTKPKGKYVIKICLGTACYVKGAQKLVDKISELLNLQIGEITKDGIFSMEVMRCVGACGLAPVITINDDVYGKLKPEELEKILLNYKEKEFAVCKGAE